MYKVQYINEYNKHEHQYFEDELEALNFFAEKMREAKGHTGMFGRPDIPALMRASWIEIVSKATL